MYSKKTYIFITIQPYYIPMPIEYNNILNSLYIVCQEKKHTISANFLLN
jgi:hypothetical protein